MEANTRKVVQIVLAAAIVLSAARLLWIMRERRASAPPSAAKKEVPLNAEYYVVPKKLHPYDLKSARRLTEQPVWTKEGYKYTYYPYDPSTRHADFKHDAATLQPIEKLEIKDIVTEVSPASADERQVLALFEKDGKHFAVPIGAVKGSDYHIYSDEMFYIQDPHQLYNFWPQDVWDSIAKHEVKPGMDELQADFAVGMGVPKKSEESDVKTVVYPAGGKFLSVTYRNGKAAEITKAPQGEQGS
jgi:hypothetical protein